MGFIPVMVFALTLGASPDDTQAFVGADSRGDRTAVQGYVGPTSTVEFRTEAQWLDTFYLGGKVSTKSDTEYKGGFRPLAEDYKVWAGIVADVEGFRVRLQYAHECLHPVASASSGYVGLFGGADTVTLTVSTGKFLGE